MIENNKEKICVVGLGYVGLPLACLLSEKFEVSGFDINKEKINALYGVGFDETGEVVNLSGKDIKDYKINYSSDPSIIKESSFIIVAVPTPIDEDKKPDLSPLESASKLVGQNLSKGAVVVYESTVYPGATEEVCIPILEQESGLKFDQDFSVGYSPERVNPGDRVHTIDKVIKIIAGSDDTTLGRLKNVYGSITEVFEASSIKVAEAAKVIENVQRSLNIALMNELALIFDKVGIPTKDVLEAAGTKWNFHPYQPGLVGGHCIGVDPYYLTYKAKKLGYDPKIILSGQEVNESMVDLVASKFSDKKNILIMGATFKENVPDIRNSKALELLNMLKGRGKEVLIVDPILNHDKVLYKTNVAAVGCLPSDVEIKFDGIIVFSPHDEFKEEEYSLKNLKSICEGDAIIFDVKGFYNKAQAEDLGFKYLTL